jgi:hypothetical protein
VKRSYVLIVREGEREMYWAGDRWSLARDAAQSFSSQHDAAEARRHLESDRDVRILVVVGARPSASA